MPDTVEAAVPWVRFDRRRLYLVGSSMGGQESLVGLARAPDRFAAVAAYDGAADLAARYKDMGAAGQSKDQAKLRRELQGVPARRPFEYGQRSPLSLCQTLATCGVPLRVVWSTEDEVVTRTPSPSSAACAGAFARLRRRCRSPRWSPRSRTVGRSAAIPWRSSTSWPREVSGARDKRRRRRPGRTRAGNRPSTWGWRLAVPGATGTRWWRVGVAGDTITVSTPSYLRLSLPWSDDAAVRVVVNGRTRRVSPRDGRLTLAFLAGDGVAVIRR